jgi:hypothetical protein
MEDHPDRRGETIVIRGTVLAAIAAFACSERIEPASDGMQVWETIPTPMILIPSGDPWPEMEMDIGSAAKFWNDIAPGTFVHTLVPDGLVVPVTCDDLERDHGAAFTRYMFNPAWRVVSASIHVTRGKVSTLEPWKRVAVIRHELGHVLGLGHSSSPGHVMSKKDPGDQIHEADRMFVRVQVKP